MANESHDMPLQEQEALLVQFYADILSGQDQPSGDYQKKFLLQLISTKIAQLEPKTRNIKRLHFFLRIAAMVLAATTTVLLGFKARGNALLGTDLNNLALIISAAMTLLSGLAVFWDTENYWLRNKIMLNKLKQIRYEYVFFLAGCPAPTTAGLRPFLQSFLDCLGDEYWEQFIKNRHQDAQSSVPD